MLKAYDDSQMSKTRIVREKYMIITASRGRKVKVLASNPVLVDPSGVAGRGGGG